MKIFTNSFKKQYQDVWIQNAISSKIHIEKKKAFRV